MRLSGGGGQYGRPGNLAFICSMNFLCRRARERLRASASAGDGGFGGVFISLLVPHWCVGVCSSRVFINSLFALLSSVARRLSFCHSPKVHDMAPMP